MDFTYVRTWSGWVYVAFVVDVFAQRIMARHAASTKDVDLVMTRSGWPPGSVSGKVTRCCPGS